MALYPYVAAKLLAVGVFAAALPGPSCPWAQEPSAPVQGPILPDAVSFEGRPEDPLGMTAFDGDGRLLYQSRLIGGIEEVRVFSYRASRLTSVSLYVGGGQPIVFGYVYGPDGRLLSMRAGHGEVAGSSPSGDAWYAYADERGEVLLRSSYNGDGTLAARLTYRYGDSGAELPSLELEERYSYKDGLAIGLVSRNLPNDTERRVTYDDRGRPWREEFSRAGKPLSRTERAWDDQGRLKSESLWSDQGVEETVAYEYDRSGALTAERHSAGGFPVLVRIFEAGGVVLEEQYDKGALFARVWKKDGRAFKEQILRDGVVLRERTLP